MRRRRLEKKIRWRTWGAIAGALNILAGSGIIILVSAAGAASECCQGDGSSSGFGDGLYIGMGLIILLSALVQLMSLVGTPLVGTIGAAFGALPQIALLAIEALDSNTDLGGVLFWSLPLPLLLIAAWRAMAAHRRER